MGKQQNISTREFKVEAVQLVKSSGKPMRQIARELGVSASALYQWCKHLAEEARAGVSWKRASDGSRREEIRRRVLGTRSHPKGDAIV